MYSAVLATVKKNSGDKMSDYLKSLGMLLQYSIKQNPWNYRVSPSNFLWGKENFLPLGLLLLMYVCRQRCLIFLWTPTMLDLSHYISDWHKSIVTDSNCDNHRPCLLLNRVFIIKRFVCKLVLPSLLSPCSIFCSRPTFPTAKTSEPSFFDFSSLQNATETLAM